MSTAKKEMAAVLMGVFFCLSPLLFHQYGLTCLPTPLDPFGKILSTKTIWAGYGTLLSWGIISVVFRKRDFVLKISISLTTLFIVIPVFGEGFFRTAIFLNVPHFREPRLYAGWFDDEDYWKLRHLWKSDTRPAQNERPFALDPLLGWTPRTSAENPLGIVSITPYVPNSSGKTVLCYGDSYVEGVQPAPIEARIPQQVQRLLQGYTVHNFGVSGYGVDQIYLRFRESSPQFANPIIVIGILTTDLDRSLFSVREAPKPYFTIENQRLALKGVPIPKDTEGWFKQHPPSINSYFLAFLVRRCRIAEHRIATGMATESEMTYKQQQKESINESIINEIVSLARSRRLSLLFVLFCQRWELSYTGWRESFLKRVFARMEVPFIDTKELFLRYAADASLRTSLLRSNLLYYPSPNNHLNELGNRLVAQAVAAHIERDLAFSSFSESHPLRPTSEVSLP